MRQTFEEAADRSFASRHLPRLRAELEKQGLDGFVVPHEDEHQNEYLPAANERLAWVSGFTGSAGAAVVMKDRAAIFTDGRYTVQVRDQVDPAFFEYLDLVEGGPPAFIASQAAGAVIGYDPRLHSPTALGHIQRAAERAGAVLRPVDVNPIDLAWGDDRPPQPQAAVVPQPERFTGEASEAKRREIGAAIVAAGADVAVLTAPASLAWLFNIRGGDVIRTPLPLGQAVVDKDGRARLFLDPAKVTDELPAWLGNEVALQSPETLAGALDALDGQSVLIDPAQSSAWYFDRLMQAGAKVVRGPDPCILPRAAKNEIEIEGSRQAHIRDGAALSNFLHWVATTAQTELPAEDEIVTVLEGFREATGALKDLSFDTIAGAGPNGALPHYRPVRRTIRRRRLPGPAATGTVCRSPGRLATDPCQPRSEVGSAGSAHRHRALGAARDRRATVRCRSGRTPGSRH